MAEAGWIINNNDLFLTVLDTGKSKTKAPANVMSDEGPCPGSQITIFLLLSHMAEVMREFSGVSFIKDTNSIHVYYHDLITTKGPISKFHHI